MPYGFPSGQSQTPQNFAVNGAMRIAQTQAINTGALTTITLAAAANQKNYRAFPDCWAALTTMAAPQNFGVQINGDDPLNGARGTCLNVQRQGAYGANDAVALYMAIDGLSFEPLFGQQCMLSFWAQSSNVGLHNVAIEYGSSANTAANQVFITSYTIPVASAWQFVTIPFQFPTSLGGPNPFDFNQQMRLMFPVFVGTNLTVADSLMGSWQAAGVVTALRTASAVNAFSALNDLYSLTRVSLQLGGAFTPPAYDFETELLRCQRYYWHTFPYGTRPAQNVGATARVSPIAYSPSVGGINTWGMSVRHPVQMRTTPTVTFYNSDAANANWRNLTAAADSAAGTAVAANSDEKQTFVTNAGVAGDNTGDTIMVNADFDARL